MLLLIVLFEKLHSWSGCWSLFSSVPSGKLHSSFLSAGRKPAHASLYCLLRSSFSEYSNWCRTSSNSEFFHSQMLCFCVWSQDWHFSLGPSRSRLCKILLSLLLSFFLCQLISSWFQIQNHLRQRWDHFTHCGPDSNPGQRGQTSVMVFFSNCENDTAVKCNLVNFKLIFKQDQISH